MKQRETWGEWSEDPTEIKKRENAEHYEALAKKHGLGDVDEEIPDTISMEDPEVRGETSKHSDDAKRDDLRGREMRKEQHTLWKRDREPLREEKRNP